MRIVRVKLECLVVLEGDLRDGVPLIDTDTIARGAVGVLPGVREPLPGAKAELTLMVVDTAEGKFRAARLRDFELEGV